MQMRSWSAPAGSGWWRPNPALVCDCILTPLLASDSFGALWGVVPEQLGGTVSHAVLCAVSLEYYRGACTLAVSLKLQMRTSPEFAFLAWSQSVKFLSVDRQIFLPVGLHSHPHREADKWLMEEECTLSSCAGGPGAFTSASVPCTRPARGLRSGVCSSVSREGLVRPPGGAWDPRAPSRWCPGRAGLQD